MRTGRVAVITGASSGIGLALAERALRAGWNVFAVGRRTERLEALARLATPTTGSVATFAIDLRTPNAARRIVAQARERFERIDVLVNNAGGVAVGPIAAQSDGALYEQMETHVIVPLALTREALPALRQSKGHIFYVGSGVARIPVGTLGAYPPAKAAVRNMARILRGELRADGIAVTYVDPGAVATEFMTRAGFAGPPPGFAASPAAVAARIFTAFSTRAPVVNAVPWQTLFVAIGEAFPRVTDALLARVPQIVGGEPVAVALTAVPQPLEEPAIAANDATANGAEPASELERALRDHASRMKKLNLSANFVRGILEPGTELDLGEVAMRWAGMPNKNERALTNDVLDALADAGYLAHVAPERYRVVKSATD